MDNIPIAKRALTHLEKLYQDGRGAESTPVDFSAFYDALDADVVFEVACTSVPPEGDPARDQPPYDIIGRPHLGKQALIDAFTTDQADMRKWQVRGPLEYFGRGDRVVVLFAERWMIERVNEAAVPWCEAAAVFDFRDGKILRYLHIADMSGHIAAHAKAAGNAPGRA